MTVREALKKLRAAGFVRKPGGKTSHQKWVHPKAGTIIVPVKGAGRELAANTAQNIEEAVEKAKGQ